GSLPVLFLFALSLFSVPFAFSIFFGWLLDQESYPLSGQESAAAAAEKVDRKVGGVREEEHERWDARGAWWRWGESGSRSRSIPSRTRSRGRSCCARSWRGSAAPMSTTGNTSG